MKQAAFTLVEGVCALVITALLVININLALTSIKHANQVDLDPTIDWYLFMQELESPTHQFELVRVEQRHLFLYSRTMQKDYELKGSTSLYLSCVQNGGYLPLLDNLKPHCYRFKQLDAQRVLVEVERINGTKNTGIIRFKPVDHS